AKCDEFVSVHFPGLRTDGYAHHIRCLYTQTTLADEDFIVGKFPGDVDIVVACGFGGEGFKFGPAIGEFVTELLLEEAKPTVPAAVHRFRVARALSERS
ncbi:unnamed protein product, partial [Polarella glacialis]